MKDLMFWGLILSCMIAYTMYKAACVSIQEWREKRRVMNDPAAKVKWLEKQLADKRWRLASVKAKLGSEVFVGSAPAEIVQQQRNLAADLESQIQTMEAELKEKS